MTTDITWTNTQEDSVKITIIGGSQGTGALLASLARDAGHDVTALSRSGTAPEGVQAVAGDGRDFAVVTSAVAGAEAVVVTVGGAKGVPDHRAAVTRTVIAAMHDAGVRRLVVQSSLGAGDSGSQLPLPVRLFMRALLAKPLADHNQQEAAVTSSGLDWTLVRPAGLTTKPATGEWHALEVTSAGQLRGSIPRADLAACILGLLDDESTVGTALGVSSR